ncbi:MAG: sulfite exporter TauE/SafE family protein [Candidatus Omnitrophica bacterium]|nr:sulfite exporter TauE/SafE family protein [Candidatus Omnitrophota bacterium]
MSLPSENIGFLAAFLGGVAVSFTPCIYPLIPVIVGVVTADAFGSKLKSFVLSLIFVSGIAVTYASLGLIATLTSRHFGSATAHPVFNYIVGGIVFLFGLHMLDVIKFHIPAIKLQHKKYNNHFLSVFLMGIVSGLAISPCSTPVLGSILAYAGKNQNFLYEALLLVSFAFGMGLILILAGVFSGLLESIPKPGPWMIWVKRTLGLVLIIWALYFIYLGMGRI